MIGWITLAAQDVLNQFNDSETSAYDAAKGDANSVSLPDIIAKVSAQIQQAFSDAGRLYDQVNNVVPATGMIPAGEANRAIAIIRWKYLLAIPTGKALAENRADEASKAGEYFQMVAQRKFPLGSVAVARSGIRVDVTGFDKIGST